MATLGASAIGGVVGAHAGVVRAVAGVYLCKLLGIDSH